MKILSSTLIAVAVLACGRTNPVNTAMQATPEHRPETVAYALHNSYVVLAERAIELVESRNTPTSVKRVLVNLQGAASPVVARLQQAADEYSRVKAALSAGTSTPEKLASALAELNRLLGEAAPKVNALAGAITENP